MGLSEIKQFNPEEKIIEYVLSDKNEKKLADLSLSEFVWSTSSDSPAPGGGSVSAAMGAMGAALGSMVANLSAHKRGWDDKWEMFASWAEKGAVLQKRLLDLVDEDTEAFNGIMKAFEMPKKSEEEKSARSLAIENATKYASMIPLTVMKEAFKSFELLEKMVTTGNPNSVTDAAVGVLATRACIRGAYLNVRINVSSLTDRAFAGNLIREGEALELKAAEIEQTILEMVDTTV